MARRSEAGDPIAVVEACYALDGDEGEWLQGIADALHPILRPEIGLAAYRVLPPDGVGYRMGEVRQSAQTDLDIAERLGGMRDLLERRHGGIASFPERAQAAIWDRILRTGLQEPVTRVLWSERETVGPQWMHTLFTPTKDQHVLLARHLDGSGATAIVSALAARRAVTEDERELLLMLLAHVDAGHRLRARLAGDRGVDAPPGGAVLDDHRVVHADGEASDRDRRAALEEAARRIDAARTSAGGRGPDAVAVWEGLVDGRWSLVESFDSDGRRYLLAHRNDPGVGDPRRLTPSEVRVLGLAVRGLPDKLIAYHLGMSRSTAAGHLSSAMKKLRIERRVDLVRYLGPSFPGNGGSKDR